MRGLFTAALQIAHHFTPQWRDIHAALVRAVPIAYSHLDFVTFDIVGLVDRNAFQFDRGLRFVVHGAPIQDHGRNGIEEPSQARRQRRVDAALDHALEQSRFLLGGPEQVQYF